MSDRPAPPPDDAGPSEPEPSREAVTPRGGFMARPGLKQPPRHAVVVRLGDADLGADIPVARASKPPPEPQPVSAREQEEDKVTLRAIPSPRVPLVELPVVAERAAPVVESVPPPSDMPVVATVRPAELVVAKGPRKSGRAIALAAAAGIVLGLATVAMKRLAQADAHPPAAAGVSEALPSLEQGSLQATASASPLASSAPAPSHRAAPLGTPARSSATDSGAPATPARRSIF